MDGPGRLWRAGRATLTGALDPADWGRSCAGHLCRLVYDVLYQPERTGDRRHRRDPVLAGATGSPARRPALVLLPDLGADGQLHAAAGRRHRHRLLRHPPQLGERAVWGGDTVAAGHVVRHVGPAAGHGAVARERDGPDTDVGLSRWRVGPCRLPVAAEPPGRCCGLRADRAWLRAVVPGVERHAVRHWRAVVHADVCHYPGRSA